MSEFGSVYHAIVMHIDSVQCGFDHCDSLDFLTERPSTRIELQWESQYSSTNRVICDETDADPERVSFGSIG